MPGWQVWILTKSGQFRTYCVLGVFLVETVKRFCFSVTAVEGMDEQGGHNLCSV